MSLATLAGVALLAGCEPDDQTSIKPEHKLVADPAPVSSDGTQKKFKENNDKHKILLGVFDTGVDYNHPYLRDHIHFDLDEAGKPVGAGVDFLTLEDKWASHRIIRTSSYEFEFLSERQKKDALREHKTKEVHDAEIRRTRMGRVCAVNSLLKIDPKLEKWLHAYRDIATERSETNHGTHVAGLMSYDNEAIGLVPYRVLPYFQTEKDEADFAVGKADKFVDNFEKAVDDAHKKGVKIVNLSLGGSFQKPTNTNDSSYERNLEKYNNYKRLLTEGIGKVVKNRHDMLFVAAAGNDSGWSDNEARLQYPCGIEAPNILCVGALNKDGTLAQFTNLPLNQVDLVLAPGVKVLSTVPSDYCGYLTQQFNSILTAGRGDAGMCRYDLKEKKWVEDAAFAAKFRTLISTFHEVCSKEKLLFEEMSGTSMATPIVSRLAAELWLDKPTMTPKEVIAALKEKATADRRRQFVAYVLKARQPSWYKLFQTEEGGGPVPDDNLIATKMLGFWGKGGLLPRAATAAASGWFELVVRNLNAR